MNAVRFTINYYFRAALISYIFTTTHHQIGMKTAYKFRLYPTRQQEAQLDLTLETCRHLYNTALVDRRNAYEVEGISRSYEDQAAMLTAEKKNGNFKGVFSQVLQDVLIGLTQLDLIAISSRGMNIQSNGITHDSALRFKPSCSSSKPFYFQPKKSP